MEPNFDIPRRRPAMPIWRICLLMGLTALLLIVLTSRLDIVAALFAGRGFV